ncbi:hypothetical protein FPV67DRAFT_1394952, partial [Lyophyllum atratum]
ILTIKSRDIMRDNMLVNPTGLPGHAMGIDLNIEHLIGYLKVLFAAKGLYANWDRLGDISAAVNHLQRIKIQVTRSMRANYQGSSHTEVNTDALGWCIANKVRDLRLQDIIEDRTTPCKLAPDLRAVGREKFELSSLATFNKKMRLSIAGKAVEHEPEVDELPPVDF